MALDDIYREISENMGITEDEVRFLIKGSLLSWEPEYRLYDVLGDENIQHIPEILEHMHEIIETDVVVDDYFCIEHTLPEINSVKPNPKNLVKTQILKENQKYFDYENFNAVQSGVFDSVYNSNRNVLVAAPTGAGKTDIALLAVLRALTQNPESRPQVIYMVPMKALATEITSKYQKKLKNFNVIEYTGDTEIEAKVASNADVIICTPEKFDASTRRLFCVFKRIGLVIIDEIHLLGEDRGPVLESLVSRIFMMVENEQRPIRIIGLSATLPNYKDVAEFIKAEDVFYFDSSFRPVPLEITVTGFKKTATLNNQHEYLVGKLKKFKGMGKQVLVFVHSRGKTLKVAKSIMQSLVAPTPESDQEEEDKKPVRRKSTVFDVEEDLLVLSKIGIHHAGMPRNKRLKMEELFKNGEIDILVCTSTLAWGVNLPAYAVIIFGTSFYNPLNGQFDDLGILDVIQIFGRAGRPQYDTSGCAILMTKSNILQRYVQQLKGAKDIESRMLYHVTDALCSEIYLGNVYSMATALKWIKNTFLYVRMYKNPALYGLCRKDTVFDEQALSEYIYLALKRLFDCALINVGDISSDYNSWKLEATPFGRIASLYYLSHETLHLWLSTIDSLNNEFSFIEMLAKSKEFTQMTTRPDEVSYLAGIHTQMVLDCAIDFEFDTSVETKIMILVIAHLKYIKMNLFSLQCDTTFVIDNIGRMTEALLEILRHMRKYDLYKRLYSFNKNILREKRLKMNRPVSAKATRLGEYIHFNIKCDDRCTLFVKEDNRVIYAARFNKSIFRFVKCKSNKISLEISLEDSISSECLDLEVHCDYSIAGLYRFGIHCCESKYTLGPIKEECIHIYKYIGSEMQSKVMKWVRNGATDLSEQIKSMNIQAHPESNEVFRGTVYTNDWDKIKNQAKDTEMSFKALNAGSEKETYGCVLDINFRLKVEFVPVEINYFPERMKKTNQIIYRRFMGPSTIVLCPDIDDANETRMFLNTKLALENQFDEFVPYNPRSNNSRQVGCLQDVIKRRTSCQNVIVKSCGSKDGYVAIYDLLKTIDGSKAVIFEEPEMIEYLKSIL